MNKDLLTNKVNSFLQARWLGGSFHPGIFKARDYLPRVSANESLGACPVLERPPSGSQLCTYLGEQLLHALGPLSILGCLDLSFFVASCSSLTLIGNNCGSSYLEYVGYPCPRRAGIPFRDTVTIDLEPALRGHLPSHQFGHTLQRARKRKTQSSSHIRVHALVRSVKTSYLVDQYKMGQYSSDNHASREPDAIELCFIPHALSKPEYQDGNQNTHVSPADGRGRRHPRVEHGGNMSCDQRCPAEKGPKVLPYLSDHRAR
ncbi:hypothetical protein Salat_1863600 [Sesamum alatum]|uniref:Uncharacterized protein n=1 Tax=Sesamum alatum TaxID=300844 RepID=A0AAE2CHW7_9LAMI|nr:hypothetical protein Salat_1863600 [Sesamum alatum]